MLLYPAAFLLCFVVVATAKRGAPTSPNRIPTSYRYGELASFAETMERIDLGLPTILYPLLYRTQSDDIRHGKVHHRNPANRQKHDKVVFVIAANKPHKRTHSPKAMPYKPASYRYGLKHSKSTLSDPKFRISTKDTGRPSKTPHKHPHHKKPHKNYNPPSYRYGEKYTKTHHRLKKEHRVHLKKHKPYCPPSYKYGRHYHEKKRVDKRRTDIHAAGNEKEKELKEILNSTMRINEIIASKDGHVKPFIKDEGDMIIRPWSPPHHNGMIKVEEKIMIVRVDNHPNVIHNFDPHRLTKEILFFPEIGHHNPHGRVNKAFGALSHPNEDDGDDDSNKPGMPFFEKIKEKLHDFFNGLGDDWQHIGLAILLGICFTFSMITFGKLLRDAWSGLGSQHRRAEDEESGLLLGNKVDNGIHPISIAYKN